MDGEKQVERRRAIEALRSGVPNRDAVLALGCSQPELEKIFRDHLQRLKNDFSEGFISKLVVL
jgi:hypothetical protein